VVQAVNEISFTRVLPLFMIREMMYGLALPGAKIEKIRCLVERQNPPLLFSCLEGIWFRDWRVSLLLR
jgi:hypothetical protein